ncbi:MAG: hypothetical protein V4604_11705 [Bacteroidota bacterium]
MASTNKKNLFQFRTLRTPGLLTEDAKKLYFVTHPDGSTGPFFEAVEDKDPSETKMAAMITCADDITAFASVAAVRSLNDDLYDYGTVLLKNRNSLVYTTVETDIAALTTLDAGDLLVLWDNLFYQTVTSESGPIREAILQLLLVNHVVTKFTHIGATDTELRKLAKSRIVLPTSLFSSDEPYRRATTTTDSVSGKHLVNEHLATAESNLQAQLLLAAMDEVKTYRAQYHRTQTAEEATEIETYNKELTTLIRSAEKDSTIDMNEIPAYEYVKPQEVVQDTMEDALSDVTYKLINGLGLFKCKTFNDLEKELGDAIRKQQDTAFKRTGFFTEKVAVDGTVLARGCSESRANQPFSFVMQPVRQAETKYSLLFIVDVGSSCLKLESMELKFGDPVTATLTKFQQSNKDGVVTINATPNSFLTLSGPTSKVTVELIFSNGLILTLPATEITLSTGLFDTLVVNSPETTHADLFAPEGFGITRLGVSDYRKVEQTLCCYVPGEVSHIENIMAREYKERSTRRLRRTEDTTTTSSSSEREHQTDTTTTSRYELQKEISQVLSESQDRSTDVNASANYSAGADFVGSLDTSFDTSSNFANSSSQENSNSESVTFAKEVTEKALDRLVSKVSEERVSKMIEEFEEQNRHGFDNRQGADHISGVFRWVDKVYKNQVHNYRNRLLYEFMIPEPASFHKMAKTAIGNTSEGIPVREPIDPRSNAFGLLTPITHAAQINESNYQQWAAAYGATVSVPPDSTMVIGKSIVSSLDNELWSKSQPVTEEIKLPDGYGINRVYVNSLGNGDRATLPNGGNWSRYYVSVAGIPFVYWYVGQPHARSLHADLTTKPELSRFTDSVPVGVQFTGIEGGVVSIELELIRKESHFAEWQLETYNAILEAYNARVQDYRDSLAEVEIKRAQLLSDNPKYFRRIENTVLKKNCIAYMISHLNMGKNFIQADNVSNTRVAISHNMDRYAATVKFFEQAFEWNIMDYTFYPFYWANRQNWGKLYGIDSDDALFRSFLQSGMARVHVTVRPGFEEAVMYYMETGQIWNGGDAPVIGDDLYLSIVRELQEPDYYIDETWETRVPSTLTVIQAKTIALEAEGLPCYCDEEEAPVESIVQPETDPLLELEVYIPGKTPETDEPDPEE